MSIITDHKYISLIAPRLPLFKRKTDRLFNFRCVFCGDSQKNKYKARGYIYEIKGHMSVKCHNCNISCSLDKLIEHIDPVLHKAYRMEKFKDRNTANTDFKIKNDVPEETAVKKVELNLPRLSELPEDNIAVQYAKLRMLPKDRWLDLYYTDNMKTLEFMNEAYKDRLPEDARLIIPFRDLKGNLIGFTGRAMMETKLRYCTLRLYNQPLVYGIDRVNTNRKVYVTEGQIDSMFIDNAIAPGGTDFVRAINMLPKKNVVLIFDNQPRNRQVVNHIEKMASQGYSMVIWPTTWNFKDINEAIMNGVTRVELMKLLNKITYSGLSLNLAIRDWKKV